MITRRAALSLISLTASTAFFAWQQGGGVYLATDVPSMPSKLEDATTETTKVLIVRSVFSPVEFENVIADAARILSYQEHPSKYHSESLFQCDRLRYLTEIDPFASNRTDMFPNRILCDSKRKHENYYASVRADFLFFARDQAKVDEISSTEIVRARGDRIQAVDVSENPVKMWNWMHRLTESQLIGYDYVWMVDGDMFLASLNWHAYWQQIKLLKPKVSQPSIIATGPGMFGSYHQILRHQKDSRVIAAETALIEVQAPLLEVGTWLGYREAIAQQPEIWRLIQGGALNCLDVTWCHYAKANLTGSQKRPQIHSEERVGYRSDFPTYAADDNSTHGQFKERSCVVLYQTPLIHGDKKAMGKKTSEYRKIGAKLRDYLGVFRIIDVPTAKTNVYDIFVASSQTR